MMRGTVFFLTLLSCGLLAAGESRMLRFSPRKSFQTGVESTASSASHSPATITTAASKHTSSLATTLQQQTGASPESLITRGKIRQTTTRTTTTKSTSRTLFTRSKSHKRRESFVPSNRPKIREKDNSRKHFALSSSVQIKQNASLTPEHNSLVATEKWKHSAKRKSNRDSQKNFRRDSRRRVTKEVKEFWDTLDQRDRLSFSLQKDKIRSTTDSSIHIKTSERGSNKFAVQDKAIADNDTVNEDFPFLSENYDYNYYYYDEPVLVLSNSSQSPELDKLITKEIVNANTSFVYNEDLVKATENPAMNNSNRNSNLSLNLDHKLSTKLIPLLTLQARNMPMLTAEGTRIIPHFSPAPPSTVPMTAIDSFRNRRQKENERNDNSPIDILKEFPIFRHIDRNVTTTNKKKSLSLHERIQNHLTPTVPTTSSTIAFTLSTPSKLSTAATPMPSTTSVTIAATTSTTTTDASTTPKSTTVFSAFISSDTPPKLEPTEMPSTDIHSIDIPQNGTNSNHVTEAIQRNVTFSTSKSHKVVETSQINLPLSLTFKSQLGFAPHGETPFGIAPFGETPMGDTPFGMSPQGQSPLGNATTPSLSENGTETEIGPEGVDGRYHVQVTGPDGSINGDYIVVDPVTGDVNGVRYEAAHDVDPLLVQRALLSFLSLNPRLSSASSDDPPAADAPTITTEVSSTTEDIGEQSKTETTNTAHTNLTETTDSVLSLTE